MKRELSFIPIFSCDTRGIYDKEDRVGRFVLALKLLAREQVKMRNGKRKNGPIDDQLGPQIREHTTRALKKTEKTGTVRSTSQTSDKKDLRQAIKASSESAKPKKH